MKEGKNRKRLSFAECMCCRLMSMLDASERRCNTRDLGLFDTLLSSLPCSQYEHFESAPGKCLLVPGVGSWLDHSPEKGQMYFMTNYSHMQLQW
jgi:hypothetical protein